MRGGVSKLAVGETDQRFENAHQASGAAVVVVVVVVVVAAADTDRQVADDGVGGAHIANAQIQQHETRAPYRRLRRLRGALVIADQSVGETGGRAEVRRRYEGIRDVNA